MVGVVLMIAVVVIASGAVFAALNQDSRLERLSTTSGEGPVVAVEAAELRADGAAKDQVVRLTHVAGPEIPVRDTRIVVSLPNGNTGTITNLPAGYGHYCFGNPNNALTANNVEGDDIFDPNCGGWRGAKGALTAKEPDTDGVWGPGDHLRFRIQHSDDGVRLKPGDEVKVRIVEESRGVVAEEALVAE